MLFSDKKKFILNDPDGYAYYWHDLRHEKRHFFKRANGGESVMVWGGIDASAVLPLVVVSTRLDSEKYQAMLADSLEPYWQPDYQFLQDNAPCHVSHSSISWFDVHGFNLLRRPAASPDLNPIENLWGILTRDIKPDFRQFSSVAELRRAIVTAWSQLSANTTSTLGRSMPKRIYDVIYNHGGITKY